MKTRPDMVTICELYRDGTRSVVVGDGNVELELMENLLDALAAVAASGRVVQACAVSNRRSSNQDALCDDLSKLVDRGRARLPEGMR